MAAVWNWEWMTSGEIADFWNELMRQKSDNVLKNFDASTTVGFGIHWGTYMTNDVVEMFLIDPFRLGRGLGSATTESVWWKKGLDVVGDFGRAVAFIPLGKITKAIPKSGTISAATTVTTASTQTVAQSVSKVPLAATKTETAIAGAYRRFFRLADPAPNEGICSFITLVNAMKHTGRVWVTIEDLARIVGVKPIGAFYKDLAKKAPCSMNEILQWYHQLNIDYLPMQNLKTVDQVLNHAATSKQDGVYIIAVKWLNFKPSSVNELGHLLYIGKTASGEVRIFDRTGYAVKTLGELESKAGYPDIRHFNMFNHDCYPVFIPNAKLIETTANGVKIAGATFGAGFGLAISVKAFTFMTKE